MAPAIARADFFAVMMDLPPWITSGLLCGKARWSADRCTGDLFEMRGAIIPASYRGRMWEHCASDWSRPRNGKRIGRNPEPPPEL